MLLDASCEAATPLFAFRVLSGSDEVGLGRERSWSDGTATHADTRDADKNQLSSSQLLDLHGAAYDDFLCRMRVT